MGTPEDDHAAHLILVRGHSRFGGTRRTYLSRLSEADKDTLERAGMSIRKGGANVVDATPIPGHPQSWMWAVRRDLQTAMTDKAELN